jgi:SPP1 gp7 family putative phage head morphogenesis protein
MAFAFKALTFDAKKTIKGKFEPSTAAEKAFYKARRKVAIASAHIVESHADGSKLINSRGMQKHLEDYARLLSPWARRQSQKLLDQVKNSNSRAYKNKAKKIGETLKTNLAENAVDRTAAALTNEHVELIRSIPIEAGLRAQKIAMESVIAGNRADGQELLEQLEKQMGETMNITIGRARVISRTETARATASINQARAQVVGSNQYRWHNSGDGAVRDSHRVYKGKRLQGQIFSWDNPPTLDDGMTGHPGTFPNCRCFAEPIFDTE